MRSRTLLPALLLGLVLLAPARAATFTVSITKAGFTPSSVTIAVGDVVTWTNSDTSGHQLVSKDAAFATPVLQPGESWSFVFETAGRYAYQDSAVKKMRGTVTVQAVPQAAATVTATASRSVVVYGSALTLSGTVSSRASGETVTIFAQPYGQTSPAAIGSAISTTGGGWSFLAKPTLQTVYEARWKPAQSGMTSSAPITVKVRPRIVWRVRAATGRVVTFRASVRGARSFGGKFVYFQRRSALGQWISLRKVVLGSTSSAIFKARLPSGRSRVRLLIPPRQAGPGYIAGISRTLVLRR
jgi:plastocyanin